MPQPRVRALHLILVSGPIYSPSDHVPLMAVPRQRMCALAQNRYDAHGLDALGKADRRTAIYMLLPEWCVTLLKPSCARSKGRFSWTLFLAHRTCGSCCTTKTPSRHHQPHVADRPTSPKVRRQLRISFGVITKFHGAEQPYAPHANPKSRCTLHLLRALTWKHLISVCTVPRVQSLFELTVPMRDA